MTYLPKPSEGSGFAPPPEGTWPAVCYRIIDLGTQMGTYNGETNRRHKVLVSWELHDPDTTTDDGSPMSIHKRFTWSMHEKSRLRQDLEAWRGKRFTDADLGDGGFHIKSLLGVPCLIGIVHTTKNGITYANISSIAKLPKGMDAPEPHNQLAYSWLTPELFDREVFSNLSDRMQETIKASPEYQRMSSGRHEHVIDADSGSVTGHLNDPVPF